MRIAHPRRTQRGLTLVELMIAVLLGLLVMAAVTALYISASRNFREDNEFARMLENGRFAMRFLADDLMMVDFWGEMLTPQDIAAGGSGINPANDLCGAQVFRSTTAEPGFVRGPVADFDCLAAAKAGTIALMIKRTSGTSTDDPEQDVVYLLTNGTVGELVYNHGAPPADPVGDDLDWRILTTIYYLNANNQLCRARLGIGAVDGNAFGNECLIDDVEDIQLLWGIDTDEDLFPNEFVVAPTAAQYRTAVSVRVCMLMRASQEVVGYTNDKVYTLCGQPVNGGAPFNDGLLRRVFEKTIQIRNPVRMALIN